MMPATMPEPLSIGDRVRWIKSPFSNYKNAEGIVVKVHTSPSLPGLTLYDILFPFGTHSVFSTALERVDGPEMG